MRKVEVQMLQRLSHREIDKGREMDRDKGREMDRGNGREMDRGNGREMDRGTGLYRQRHTDSQIGNDKETHGGKPTDR